MKLKFNSGLTPIQESPNYYNFNMGRDKEQENQQRISYRFSSILWNPSTKDDRSKCCNAKWKMLHFPNLICDTS